MTSAELPLSARLRFWRMQARTVSRYTRRRLYRGRRSRGDVVSIYDGALAEAALDDYRRNPVDIYRKDGRLVVADYRDILTAKAAQFARYIEESGARTVLEVGANCAVTTAALQRALPGVAFTAVDLSPRACRAAATHFRGSVVCADAVRLPFRSGTFDLVFTHSALYTLDDRLDAALAEIGRVTRRWFLFTEPFFESLSWVERMHWWHKGFGAPVLPRMALSGLHVKRYELLRFSHQPLSNYWIAFGDIRQDS